MVQQEEQMQADRQIVPPGAVRHVFKVAMGDMPCCVPHKWVCSGHFFQMLIASSQME